MLYEQPIEFSDKIYSPSEIDDVITEWRVIRTIKAKGKEYYNFPVAFDIETSSFENCGEKHVIMYVWMICFNGAIVLGRTWEELDYVMSRIKERLLLSTTIILPIYVHNLPYEFQFLKNRNNWDSVIAMDKYKPIRALTKDGFEYRCSYYLSGLSLDNVSEELTNHKVKKLKGNLDYDKIRTPLTPLSQKELDYCVNDVKVLAAYIKEEIGKNNYKISNIPLTKTGYVRNYCRNSCFYLEGKEHHSNEEKRKYKRYRDLMKGLTMTVEEYEQLKRAFQGGFTHANSLYSDFKCEDVSSLDIASDYPSVMVSEMFPMSKGKVVEVKDQKDMDKYLDKYCCLFDVTFYNLKSIFEPEQYISKHKCTYIYGDKKIERDRIKNKEDLPCYNNGRVVKAKVLSTTITEIDLKIIKKVYKYKYFTVDNFRIYRKDYLPTDLIKAVLKFYKDKTELKGIPEKKAFYNIAKGMLNACYGMMVTDPLRADNFIDTNGVWKSEEPDKNEAINDYNKSTKRFLFYPWGIWITAYARYNLFKMIFECGEDYIYSDTDSVKIFNYMKHKDFVDKCNNEMIAKLEKALEFHNIDKDAIRPKNKDGEPQVLGIWDFEGTYNIFKTLGAKRYMYYQKGKQEWTTDETDDVVDNKCFVITIAGLNKVKGSRYLWLNFGLNAFKEFNHEMTISEDNTGKLTHTYIDDVMEGVVYDYLGNPYEYHELSGVHLSKQPYTLKLAAEYRQLLELGLEAMLEDDWE